MKRISLCAFAALSCSLFAPLEPIGVIDVAVTWLDVAAHDYTEHSHLLAAAKGSFLFLGSSEPPSGEIVYAGALIPDVTESATVEIESPEDGDVYTVFAFYDANGNGAYDRETESITVKHDTATFEEDEGFEASASLDLVNY